MTVTAIILTVWGWFRAELLVGQRAGFRLSIQKGGQTKDNQDSVARRGGLIFLIQHLMKQTLLIGAWFVGSAVIFIWLSRDPLSAHAKTIPEMITGNPILFSMLIVMVGLQIFPVCLQMRFFRTLPLSTNDLAAFLVLTTLSCILMIFASVVFVLVVVFQQSLVSVIQSIPKSSCAIMLLLIPVVVWSGWGRKSNMVLFLGIAAAQVYSFFWEHDHWRSNSQTVSFVGAALVVPVAFLLTKIAIERSSRTYRPRTVSPDGSIWGRDM